MALAWMRASWLAWSIAATFPCAMGARGQAVVEGKVTLPAKPAEAVSTPRYRAKNAGAIALPEAPKAVVYLEGVFPANSSTNAAPPVLVEQKGFQFAPGLIPVLKGTRVEFPNQDGDYHNVFSYSKTKRFDLGRYRQDEKPAAIVFDQPGVVKLYCEIHEHMRGTILVLDTPFFTKSDGEGIFRLEHLPAGNYVLKAWLDEKTIWVKPVELHAGVTLHVDFSGK